jgi:hypothetical protein
VPIANIVVGTETGALVQVSPLLVNTFPPVPGATNVTESNPGPTAGAIMTPLGTVVLVPVPPLDIGIGLPEYVSAKVPVEVTGLPVTVNAAGAVSATEVTPLPPPAVADNVPPTKLRLDPITTFENPPLPLPDRMDVPLVKPLTLPMPGMSS